MPMLKEIISNGSTLIDYEKVTNEKNQRLIYFGRYAGDAGAINILWLMGEYWNHHGIETPFLQFKQACHYHSVKEAQDHLREIGKQISGQGLPEQLSPVVIGILGYGNVSTGTQQIIDCLPIETVEPGDLKSLIEDGRGLSNKIYKVVFNEQHLVKHKADQPFNLLDYYQHPENYVSRFDLYLPYISILINAIYWDNRYPKFVKWDSLKKLYEENKKPKLTGIADITCDVNGSVECNVKTTNTGMPAYLCDPLKRTVTDGHKGDGILVLATDNLPAELPNDSSVFFSNQLKKIVPNLIHADYDKSLAESGLSAEIQKAVIVYQGKLTPAYEYLNQYLS